MARGFGSTYGAGATDSVKTAYTTVPAAQYSIALWAWLHGSGGFTFGIIESQTGTANNVNHNIYMNGGVASIGFDQAFTGNTGNFSIAAPATNKWFHLAVTYDSSSTSNKPVMYLNGVSQTVTTLSSPTGSVSNAVNNLYIGNNNYTATSGQQNFDGMLAEYGYWNGSILTAAEVLALAKGVTPRFVRPSGLSLYLPLLGVGSGEPDWGPSRVTQTITATAKRNHAPVSFWMPPTPVMPTSRFNGSLGLTQGALSAAIAEKEKFVAAMADIQPASTVTLTLAEKFHAAASAVQQNATLSLAGREKFSNYLTLTASANLALMYGCEIATLYPGHAVIGDAMEGGLLALADQTAYGLAAADAALYDVQITESI